MRLAVLGVGLIGGSIGLAARSRVGAHVRGYDADERALAAALELGAIDEAAGDLAEAVRDAEAVFVCTPVGALPQVVSRALAAAGPECLVTDVGSTKRAIVAATQDERFIGGHPLAGAATAGVEHARADLFDGASWYLTPAGALASAPQPPAGGAIAASSASGERLERLRALIAMLGAQPIFTDAPAHDRLMAHLSHLPHVFANVLVAGAADALGRERREGAQALPGLGPSFRDATRVAGANTAIWTDIYLSNGEALIEAIDDAVGRLRDVRAALGGRDAQALAQWNERALQMREHLRGSGMATDA